MYVYVPVDRVALVELARQNSAPCPPLANSFSLLPCYFAPLGLASCTLVNPDHLRALSSTRKHGSVVRGSYSASPFYRLPPSHGVPTRYPNGGHACLLILRFEGVATFDDNMSYAGGAILNAPLGAISPPVDGELIYQNLRGEVGTGDTFRLTNLRKVRRSLQ